MVILIASFGVCDKLVLLEEVDEEIFVVTSNVYCNDWLCSRTIWLLS